MAFVVWLGHYIDENTTSKWAGFLVSFVLFAVPTLLWILGALSID